MYILVKLLILKHKALCKGRKIKKHKLRLASDFVETSNARKQWSPISERMKMCEYVQPSQHSSKRQEADILKHK